jgi:hypothetical protein
MPRGRKNRKAARERCQAIYIRLVFRSSSFEVTHGLGFLVTTFVFRFSSVFVQPAVLVILDLDASFLGKMNFLPPTQM